MEDHGKKLSSIMIARYLRKTSSNLRIRSSGTLEKIMMRVSREEVEEDFNTKMILKDST